MYSATESSYRRITARLRSENAELLGYHPRSGVPEAEFSSLRNEFKSYLASENRIELFLPLGHPDLTRFLDEAKRLGLTIPNDRFEVQPVEILDYTKASLEEVEAAEYLECGMFKPAFRTPFTVTGQGQFSFENTSWLKQSAGSQFLSVPNLPHLIAVRGTAKEKLESSELVGLTFEPIFGCDGVEPLWIIWSSVKLPAMNLHLVDNLQNRFEPRTADFEKLQSKCYLCDQHEVHPSASYNELSLNFDVALTLERLGGLSKAYHRLIYSQKAKSVLEEIGMKLECVPVRIESESLNHT